MRRELIVRQRFPVGKKVHLQLRRKERYLLEQALRVPRVFGDDQQRPRTQRELRHRERIARTVKGRRTGALPRRRYGEIQHGRQNRSLYRPLLLRR
ncbi:hypothetical protein D3C83_40730 [compost metagenome]